MFSRQHNSRHSHLTRSLFYLACQSSVQVDSLVTYKYKKMQKKNIILFEDHVYFSVGSLRRQLVCFISFLDLISSNLSLLHHFLSYNHTYLLGMQTAVFHDFHNSNSIAGLKQILPIQNGGILTMPRATVKAYASRRLQEGEELREQKIPLIDSVKGLEDALIQDPSMKVSLIAALDEIPYGGVLHGKTPDDILYAMTSICQTPPKFENAEIAGLPFYSLFQDLLATRFGQLFFANTVTNYHLKQIFNDYQKMLESPASTKFLTEEPDGWFSEEAQKRANYSDYQLDPSKPHWGFKSWNDWFTRKLRPGARPVDPNPKAIVHSSDSFPVTYREGAKGTNPTFNVQADNHFWLKDNSYSLHDMLGSRQQKIEGLVDEHFVGGTIYQAFLDPWCYHRWHAPISGTVIHSYRLEGTYFFYNPYLPSQIKQNYVQSLPMLSAVSVRHVFMIRLDDGSGRLVAVIEIGMTQVSGCHPTVAQGDFVKKGDELGYFEFGGSSYAMVFDKDFDLTFKEEMFYPTPKDNDHILGSSRCYVNSLLCTFE